MSTPKRPSHYERLVEIPEEPAVLRAIAKRVEHRKLNRKITRAKQAITKALGPQKDLLLELETLTSQRSVEYEQACFDVGYEHGFAEGRVDGWIGASRREHVIKELARGARFLSVQAGLTPVETVAALLEATYSLISKPKRRKP